MAEERTERVYFIGIGGIGMSALARYFHQAGKPVAGYDRTPSPITEELQQLGISIQFEENIGSIPKPFLEKEGTLVIWTPAIPDTHPGLQHFREQGFRLLKRSKVLGEVTRDTRCLAVAGTHGKTTTSAILAHLVYEGGLPVTAFLGGMSENFNSNFLLEGSEFTVVEADEYDRSFLQLQPEIACVTSMDADHLDIYGDGETLEHTFREFAGLVKPGGKLLVRYGLPLDGLTYGPEDGADYQVHNVRIDNGAYVFDLKTPSGLLKELRFSQPGRHNLWNATVAVAMALEAGVPAGKLPGALQSYKGVARRFSYKINTGEFIFIDDYAHHPTEIDAVYQAVTELYPGKEILVIFQPHLYSRTRDFAEAFAKSLSAFDHILLLPIYPAREKPIPGITSEWLLWKVETTDKALVQKEQIVEEINRRRPEVLLTLGAGDIGIEANRIKKELSHG